ncbi:MAG: NTP transferase domain-containing protein [Thermoflexales bacterium]
MSDEISGQPALYGLVLAGGESRRMGRDKGLIAYRGEAHRQVLYALLRSACDRVFLSVNPAQPRPEPERFEYLVDRPEYAGNGPIGAVMGFRDAHPGLALLLVSCDLPYFGPVALQALLAARNSNRPATAFLNPQNDRPEPLVTIYEPGFLGRLPAHFSRGARSLQRVLLEDPPALIRDFDLRWIDSADTPEDAARARAALGGADGGPRE